MQTQSYRLLKVQDPAGLSEADWTELGKLQRAYSLGGNESLSKALDELLISNSYVRRRCDPSIVSA